MKFVVYEVWTRARVVDATTEEMALAMAEKKIRVPRGLNLSNWHAVPVSVRAISSVKKWLRNERQASRRKAIRSKK